jgi:uncharacterized membrane protein YgcG
MVPLSAGEKIIKYQLFKGKIQKVTLNNKYQANLSAAKTKLTAELKKEFHKQCFIDNSSYMIWGWLISAVCLFVVTLLIYSASMTGNELFITLFSSCIFLIIVAAFMAALPVFSGLLIIIILATSYMELWDFLVTHQVWLFFTLFLLSLNLLFGYLLRSPSVFGRHIKDQIDGLKLYMKSAEENRLNVMNPPDKTIAYYEKLLPYAVALSLENQWANKFADVLKTENPSGDGNTRGNYQPNWYQSDTSNNISFSFSAATISRSLKSAVAASTKIPSASGSSSSSSYSSSSSSSSSSRSGGSSGGGGGGGGGGGW